MLQAPLDHPLNLTTQAVLTYASWTIAAALLLLALQRSIADRTPFQLCVVLAGGVAALAEPLYDLGFKLLFYIPGQWTLYTYYEIPQPVWTVSGYITLYSGPAIFICERLARGIGRREFVAWIAGTMVASSVFEIYGIKFGAYTYWGPHALRIFDYPLAVAVLETTFVTCFCLLANELRQRLTAMQASAAMFLLFPATFYAVNFGIGAPILVTIGLVPASPTLVLIATCMSIAAALMVLSAVVRYAASRKNVATQGAPNRPETESLHPLRSS